MLAFGVCAAYNWAMYLNRVTDVLNDYALEDIPAKLWAGAKANGAQWALFNDGFICSLFFMFVILRSDNFVKRSDFLKCLLFFPVL